MSDTITAKGNDAKFRPHEEGQFVAQCVDTIDLGERVEEFAGKPKKLSPKCAIVFRTGETNPETGEPIDVAKEFTVSMGEKANLRKFLEAWRGKKYTAEQVAEGVPLHKLTGNFGLLSVEHRLSGGGKTYANIAAIVGVPKQMAESLPTFPVYSRAEFWAERKKEYAEAARKFRADAAISRDDDGEIDDRINSTEDDDLPF